MDMAFSNESLSSQLTNSKYTAPIGDYVKALSAENHTASVLLNHP
jgi:hypothetical protein